MLSARNIHNTTVELANADGIRGDPVLNFFTERYAEAYANEVMTFVAAVTNKKPIFPNGFDGLQAQKLADAVSLLLVDKTKIKDIEQEFTAIHKSLRQDSAKKAAQVVLSYLA